uniref:Secreted protein n=1 Tax=Panstrongylus lignarius TaxID=156445 RepID=A0A224XW87_9HEMI
MRCMCLLSLQWPVTVVKGSIAIVRIFEMSFHRKSLGVTKKMFFANVHFVGTKCLKIKKSQIAQLISVRYLRGSHMKVMVKIH